MDFEIKKHHTDEPTIRKKVLPRFISVAIIVFIFSASLFSFTFKELNEPSVNFPINEDITISKGMTLSAISTHLEQEHVVRSSFLFYLWTQMIYPETKLQAGTYRFTSPITTGAVIHAIAYGESLSPVQKVTFPEGFRILNMPQFLPTEIQLPDMNAYAHEEGYLFPDTYQLPPHATVEDIITLMKDHYETMIKPLRPRIEGSGFTEKEVITLASIVEREANDETSMKAVSGILQNRLRIGMPLQADATLDYLLRKTSEELTLDDLRIDSPYNSYLYKGLPPTPIANPGLDAIEAVLSATSSDYLYYLTDNDGVFHYAKTFKEHEANIARYLRKN